MDSADSNHQVPEGLASPVGNATTSASAQGCWPFSAPSERHIVEGLRQCYNRTGVERKDERLRVVLYKLDE